MTFVCINMFCTVSMCTKDLGICFLLLEIFERVYVGSLNWFAKYLDVLLYLCAVFLCKVLIFFVQTAFVFILMGLLQPKRTKLCYNLLFLIGNRNYFHRLSHFSQGKNSFLPKPSRFTNFWIHLNSFTLLSYFFGNIMKNSLIFIKPTPFCVTLNSNYSLYLPAGFPRAHHRRTSNSSC